MQKIEQEWAEYCKLPFPDELVHVEIEGVCLASLDSFAAGCISRYLDDHSLDVECKTILEDCSSKLRKIVSELQGPANVYILRLQTLVTLIIERERDKL